MQRENQIPRNQKKKKEKEKRTDSTIKKPAKRTRFIKNRAPRAVWTADALQLKTPETRFFVFQAFNFPQNSSVSSPFWLSSLYVGMVSKFETRFWEREKGRCRDVLEREREGERERKVCPRRCLIGEEEWIKRKEKDNERERKRREVGPRASTWRELRRTFDINVFVTPKKIVLFLFLRRFFLSSIFFLPPSPTVFYIASAKFLYIYIYIYINATWLFLAPLPFLSHSHLSSACSTNF